jgi:hypothetical protein
LITVFDYSGRRLKLAKVNESGHQTIDIHELAQGSYLVRLVGKEGIRTGRFTVE